MADDPTPQALDTILADLERLRESHHDLRNAATVTGLRTERMEREQARMAEALDKLADDTEGSPMGRALSLVARENRSRIMALEQLTDTHADYITQLRTALGLLRLLVGTSVLGAAGTVVALAKALGWW